MTTKLKEFKKKPHFIQLFPMPYIDAGGRECNCWCALDKKGYIWINQAPDERPDTWIRNDKDKYISKNQSSKGD